MKIELTHSQLADLASMVLQNVTLEKDSGYVQVNHYGIKPFAKTLLWMYAQPENFTDDLPDDTTFESLYLDLEEKGELNIDKKDLPKYKFYMEMVYGLIDNVEDHNKQVQTEALLDMGHAVDSLSEAFENLGSQIGDLNEDAIRDKANRVAEMLKQFEQ